MIRELLLDIAAEFVCGDGVHDPALARHRDFPDHNLRFADAGIDSDAPGLRRGLDANGFGVEQEYIRGLLVEAKKFIRYPRYFATCRIKLAERSGGIGWRSLGIPTVRSGAMKNMASADTIRW